MRCLVYGLSGFFFQASYKHCTTCGISITVHILLTVILPFIETSNVNAAVNNNTKNGKIKGKLLCSFSKRGTINIVIPVKSSFFRKNYTERKDKIKYLYNMILPIFVHQLFDNWVPSSLVDFVSFPVIIRLVAHFWRIHPGVCYEETDKMSSHSDHS